MVPYLASLPATYCLYVARFNLNSLNVKLPLKQLIACSMSILLFIAIALSTNRLPAFDRFAILYAPGLCFTMVALFRLGQSLLRRSDGEILDVIGAFTSTSPPPIANVNRDEQPNSLNLVEEITESVRRPLYIGRLLCAYSFMIYGGMQIFYLLKGNPWFIVLFWFALSLKACNGAGVALLVLADFRAVGEAYRLQSLAAELGALTASVEHDIRNPISTMNKTLANLKRKFQHEASIQKAVLSLEAQISRVNSAVDVIPQLRESRVYYQKRFKRWDLVEISNSAIKVVKDAYRGNLPLRIEATSSHPDIPIAAYRERLMQAIVNIMTNSIEAYEATGITKTALITLTASLNRSDGIASLAIKDEAGGIPAELIPMITRPMFSTKGDGKGNRGIGLFTAERFVIHHRGRLLFDTDNKSFTRITIELPAYTRGER